MSDENQNQQTNNQDGQQGGILNPNDAIRELREENAARRVENNELKALLTSVLETLKTGQAPEPPEVKTKKGQDALTQVNETLEGFKSQLEAVKKEAAEVQTIKQQLEAAENARKVSELSALKVRIGAKYGLPEAITERLQGSTPDEIENDAKALQPIVAGQKRGLIGNVGELTQRTGGQTLFDRARGGNQNPFSPEFHKSGGVVADE